MTTQTQNQEFGVNVWWTCPEFILDVTRVHSALESEGFEPDKDMPIPSRRNVVSRAAYSFQDRRHKDGRRVTEKARDNDDVVTYGILGLVSKSDEEVSYDQSTTVTLHKDSGRVEAHGVLAEDFMKALGLYENSLTDLDVRNFLREVIRMCKGIAKRPTGGIYFVPDRYVDILKSVQQVLSKIDVGARLYVERVVNGTEERTIVWDAVQSDIESQIDATLLAVSRIEKRANAVTSHQAKLSELSELMRVYQELLGEEAKCEDLAERLNSASNQVAAKMTQLQQESDSRTSAVEAMTVGSGYKRSRINADIAGASQEVLSKANKPMHYAEIAKALEANGVELRSTATKTKEQWVLIQINKSVANGEGKLIQLGKGVYAAA